MSVITLEEAKAFLDVIHGADDVKLQMLLDGAEDEAAQFMGRENLLGFPVAPDLTTTQPFNLKPSSDPLVVMVQQSYMVAGAIAAVPYSVRVGVMLLLQASYQASPEDMDRLRRSAETKLMPYRCGLGV